MNREIKKTLKETLNVEEPTRRNEFLDTLDYTLTKKYKNFVSQVRYISKRFWVMSFLISVVIFIIYKKFDVNVEVVGVISSFVPFLVLVGVNEINKSVAFNMAELENSCRYDFNTVTLIRLTIIGVFHFILLAVILMFFRGESQYGLFRYVLYSITPFTLSAYASFFVISHLKIKDSIYICSLVTIFIAVFVLILNIEFTEVYDVRYVWVWCVVSIAVMGLLSKEIYNIANERVVQWSLA